MKLFKEEIFFFLFHTLALLLNLYIFYVFEHNILHISIEVIMRKIIIILMRIGRVPLFQRKQTPGIYSGWWWYTLCCVGSTEFKETIWMINERPFPVSKTIQKHLLGFKCKTQLKLILTIFTSWYWVPGLQLLIQSHWPVPSFFRQCGDHYLSSFSLASHCLLGNPALSQEFPVHGSHGIMWALQNESKTETNHIYSKSQFVLYQYKGMYSLLNKAKIQSSIHPQGCNFSLSIFIVCLFIFLPHRGYSWYCLSVAVKKSSRRPRRYSKVGLSSWFSFQHIPMTW